MEPDLFYVLDIGDALEEPLSKFLQPTAANATGHLVSFAVNSALWLGFIAAATFVVKETPWHRR